MSIHAIASHTPAPAPRDRHPAPADDKSTTPFPSQGQDDAEEAWAANPDPQRTVRRKKSSFDLRDVFKNGGIIPTSSAVSAL